MPMLPSGRHVGLKRISLDRMIEDAVQGYFVHKLMVIESVEQLFPYLDVIYYKLREDGAATLHQPADKRLVSPSDQEEVRSGFTLTTIREELVSWPEADQVAFFAFLDSEHCLRYLNNQLASVISVKQAILTEGQSVPRLVASWWIAGVHPLQCENEKD